MVDKETEPDVLDCERCSWVRSPASNPHNCKKVAGITYYLLPYGDSEGEGEELTLDDGLGDLEALALGEELGLIEGDTEELIDGLTEALGDLLIEADGLILAEGDILALGDELLEELGDTDALGLKEALLEELGLELGL